ncbi:MAG: hypothetical protein OEM15_07435 [Myxococcales bacterium]|nr:hypothetical protein [Myxococcales bacterium]MDH3485196.1 hypothetical protein [Myxococcales bacterium]
MTTEIRDPQFARFVDELTNSLSFADLSFAFSALETVAASIVVLYDAFATPEPGFLTRAFKGFAV